MRCLISTSVFDNGASIIDRELKNMAVATWDNVEFIHMVGRKRFIDESDELKLYVKDRGCKEINEYIRKLEKKQVVLSRFDKFACNNVLNIMGYTHPSWKDKFTLVARYCNDLQNYKEINGCVKFNGYGFKVNKLAIYKTDLLLTQLEEALIYIQKNRFVRRLSAFSYKPDKKQNEGFEEPYIAYIRSVLKEENRLYKEKGNVMDNDALKELKIKSNEAIKVINSTSKFAMKKVNTTSNTLATSKWIIGVGIPYAIFYLPRDSHTKKPRYAVLELGEEEHKHVLEQIKNGNTEVFKLSGENFVLPDT